jgi:peptide/nickel transport system substrate-binding protein
MIGHTARLALAAPAALLLASLGASAQAQGTLRIAMTASDVPTTTGAPDNGFEGLRFFGYPVYEGLVLWDLTRADKLAEIRPGLAESWEQDQNDRSKWVFHLRRGVKFHDGSDFNADAVIWNLDRYFKPDAPQADPTGGAFARARDPWITGYRKRLCQRPEAGSRTPRGRRGPG